MRPPSSLLQVAAAVAFGLLAGWLRMRTGSLMPPVQVHAAMNLIAAWL
jgi:membrane protease YdiL (CAAX protease family)